MRNNAKFLEAFSTFGESELTPNIISIIEEFTCAMYQYPHCKSVNDAEFDKKCKPKAKGNPLDSIKLIDPTTFPPCSRYHQVEKYLFSINYLIMQSSYMKVANIKPKSFIFEPK